MADQRHRDNFMILRLVAAILVIYGHAFPLTGTVPPGYLGNSIQTLAVKIFFVISGYLIAQSWSNDPNILRYLARRTARIMPGLWAVCIGSVLIAGPLLTSLTLGEYFDSSQTYDYLKNLVLNPQYALPGVFEDTIYPRAVNGSLWTLPVEFFMYLMLPLILVLPKSRYLVVVAAFVLAGLSLYFARINVPENAPIYWGTHSINALEMMPYFLFGSVFRIWVPHHLLNLQFAVCLMFLGPLFANSWAGNEAVSLLILPYCVFAFAYAPSPLFAGVAKLGDISYGIYLYGFLIQQIVSDVIGTDGAPMQNFVISTLLTIPFAYLSWNFVERPALQFTRNALKSGRFLAIRMPKLFKPKS